MANQVSTVHSDELRVAARLFDDQDFQRTAEAYRFYGPLEPFFDKSWRPGEIERVTKG
jgi:hypothetical protein